MFPILLLLFLLIRQVKSQVDCTTAPSYAIQVACEQIQRWDEGSRTINVTQSDRPGLAMLSLPNRPQSLYQCHDMNCVCMFMIGDLQNGVCILENGVRYEKAVRKEYRTMTDDERARFHNAMWTIHNNGKYAELSDIHAEFSISPGAHSGPAFLPWHREFIKRIELALREVEPTTVLPYWDSTIDNAIPQPTDSIMFTGDLFGTGNGLVTDGVFANFRGYRGEVTRREVGLNTPTPFTEQDVQAAISQSDFMQTLSFTSPRQGCPYSADFNTLEYTHGKPHVFVGGHMLDPRTSTGDPLFWLHHSFVDLIWELWRQNRQTREQREADYPPDQAQCSSQAHFQQTIMAPFAPLTNKDGLSNTYTDNLYSYAPRPTCTASTECSSKFLFCDRSNGAPRCASKIRINGNCRGYVNGESPCYNGTCINGVCAPGETPPIDTTTPTLPTPVPTLPTTRPVPMVPSPEPSPEPSPVPSPTPAPTPAPTPSPTLPPITTTQRPGPGYPTGPQYPIIEPGYPSGGSVVEPGYNTGQGPVVEPGYGGNMHIEPGYQTGNRNGGQNVHVEPGYNGGSQSQINQYAMGPG